jgi:spore coat polysaccharide biosynthesis predicted glycosyltransferase SpsG
MKPSEIFGKRILISPLNWGFGHVSRCIPLINQLIKQNNKIFIACDEIQAEVFKNYFSNNLIFIFHAGYPFEFSGKGNFSFDLIKKSNRLYQRFKNELNETERIVSENSIDFVISDHRYGFRSKLCVSIFLTHQLILPLRWFQKSFQWYHRHLINAFDLKWVVDDERIRLAGKLSSITGFKNTEYIGFLSRFKEIKSALEKKHKGLLLISGPDEYVRFLVQSNLVFLNSGKIDIIVGVKKHFKLIESFGFSHLFEEANNWKFVDEIMLNSKKIYGYCGYTTLMDLQYLSCQSKLIPCKGQQEQMYLSKLKAQTYSS